MTGLRRKRCFRCHRIKKRTAFHADRSKDDGLSTQCRLCRSIRLRWTVKCLCGNPITVGNKLSVECLGCGRVFTLSIKEKK